MKMRTLGSSGLIVSPICLGTMTFGNPVKEKDSVKLVHQAIDLGVNFIDTANVYEGYDRRIGSAGGVAEVILGKAIKDRRDKVVVATKVGSPLGDGPQDCGLSTTHILREVDRCLERLQCDYIDLLYTHWPDWDTPMETTLRAMETVVQQGKVGYFGVSNQWAYDICEYLCMASKNVGPPVVCAQIPYSLLQRAYHNDLGFYEHHNIGVAPYRVLESGALTGKYRRGAAPPKDSRAAENPTWMPEMDAALFDTLEASQVLAEEAGVPMPQYAMAWTLAQPAITSLIIGAKRIEHVEDAIAASERELPAAILEKQDSITPPPWNFVTPFSRK